MPDHLLPDNGPLLELTDTGQVLGRASADDQAVADAVRRFLMLADDLGELHRPRQAVTALGERLEMTQGRMTMFQMRVLLALFRATAALPGDDPAVALAPAGRSDADLDRLRAVCGSDRPRMADLYAALVAAPVQLPCNGVGGRH